MKTLIVGDIHGCYDQLVRLLEKVDFQEKEDRLISLGDLMDRGGQSYEVLKYLRELKERMKDRCVILLGNHEWMAIHGRLNPEIRKMWYQNGGRATVESFERHHDKVERYVGWLRGYTQRYYEEERFRCVHAGVKEERLEENTELTLLWSRAALEENQYRGKLTVVGHTPLKDVVHFTGDWKSTDVVKYGVERELPGTGMICIDTGCVFGRRLTGMIIEEDRYWVEGVK